MSIQQWFVRSDNNMQQVNKYTANYSEQKNGLIPDSGSCELRPLTTKLEHSVKQQEKSCRQCTFPAIQMRSIMAWQELLNNQLSLPNVSTVCQVQSNQQIWAISVTALMFTLGLCGGQLCTSLTPLLWRVTPDVCKHVSGQEHFHQSRQQQKGRSLCCLSTQQQATAN